jgi:hypothetical protein
MNREDVLKVDALKAELSDAFRQFEQRLTGVFGDMVYAVDTVVDRYNDLETKHEQLEHRLDMVTARLLTIEKQLGEH